jgi:hypothetical protein
VIAAALLISILLGVVASVASASPRRVLRQGVSYNPAAGLSREPWQRRTPNGSVENVSPVWRSSAARSSALSDDELLQLLDVRLPYESAVAGTPTPLAMRQTTGDVVSIKGSKSSYVVTYSPSTPAKARVPFERGIRIWSEEFACALPIRVSFSWQNLGQTTLGATSSPFFVSGSTGGADKLDDNTVYSPVVAMALQGVDYVAKNEYAYDPPSPYRTVPSSPSHADNFSPLLVPLSPSLPR